MDKQDEKVIEQRGYSKGYAAGRRRQDADIRREALQAEERAFWDKVFVAATPAFIRASGWKQGDRPLTSLQARCELARDFANAALEARRRKFP